MRRFSAEYLQRTREGMWEDSTAALAELSLSNRSRILDVGCGTGELTQVLASEAARSVGPEPREPTTNQDEFEESAGQRADEPIVIGVDADPGLLSVARSETGLPVLAGAASRLPFSDDAFDLVVCQALLVNLSDPAAAIEEFARVSSDLVAAIEPDNSRVQVDSTVQAEQRLEGLARRAFIRGVETDVAPGDRVGRLFDRAGLTDVSTREYVHERRVEPPYATGSLEDAARKASGAGLDDHESELRDGLGAVAGIDSYDDLRERWRQMGRTVADQMSDRRYRRTETVPFEVTVGTVD